MIGNGASERTRAGQRSGELPGRTADASDPTADWDDRASVVTQNAPGEVAGPERTCKESFLVAPSNASSVLSVLSRLQLSQNLRQLATPVCDGRSIRSGIAITASHSVTVARPSSWSKTFVHWRENLASACDRKYGPSTITV